MRAELPTGTWWIRGKGKVYCYNQPGGGQRKLARRAMDKWTSALEETDGER